jgi:hypothetical protein
MIANRWTPPLTVAPTKELAGVTKDTDVVCNLAKLRTAFNSDEILNQDLNLRSL